MSHSKVSKMKTCKRALICALIICGLNLWSEKPLALAKGSSNDSDLESLQDLEVGLEQEKGVDSRSKPIPKGKSTIYKKAQRRELQSELPKAGSTKIESTTGDLSGDSDLGTHTNGLDSLDSDDGLGGLDSGEADKKIKTAKKPPVTSKKNSRMAERSKATKTKTRVPQGQPDKSNLQENKNSDFGLTAEPTQDKNTFDTSSGDSENDFTGLDNKTLSPVEPERKSSVATAASAQSPDKNIEKPVNYNRTNELNEILNLEFKTEADVSRVVVSSRFKLKIKEFNNRAMKQLVYVFENTQVPERLERAYDTSEFASPVALFTLLQVPQNKVPTAKLIIQLREDKTPTISNTEKGLYLEFPSSESAKEPRISAAEDSGKLMPEESTYSNSQAYYGKPIERLEISDTNVRDVIRLIGKSSGYNIVIGEDVTGKIGTISLESIPWDQAFAIVLQSKKLGYVRQGNVLRVATLASLKAEKEEIAAVEQSKVKAEPLRTVLIPVSYAKAQELSSKGKTILTERGTLEVDERSNSIIVRDVERVVSKLQKLYAMLDTQPPIVSVSAKVVEMKSDFQRTFGMNALKLWQNTSGIAGEGFDYTPETSTVTIKRPDFARLEARISLAELEGETKVLANPSVSVNQNQKAVFNQTLSAFYKVQQQAVAGAIPQQTLQSIDTTLSLEATPIVSGDGSISMTVNVKNEVPQANPGAAEVAVDKRSIQTQVLLENGDTAVIGGAFSSTATSGTNGIPGLMKLPLVGLFFSNKTVKETKNEILIFLTAKILNAEESFKRTF